VTAAALLIAAAVTAAVVRGGPPEVAVPRTDAASAALCRTLHAALPRAVDGAKARTPRPKSALTAAWGDPAITLRCGVPRPKVLTPGSPGYDPTAESFEINGVTWLPEQLAHGYRFTTLRRKVLVEVTVPHHYNPEVNPLTDLAKAVKRTDPGTPS
jgi:hypothetical protein